MDPVPRIVAGFLLVAVTVSIHAVGSIALLGFMTRYRVVWSRHQRAAFAVMSLSGIVASLVFLHLVETGAWAVFFWWKGLFPDLETAAYYSLATYTTVGYGDVVLPKEWRILGTSEALVGILMSAWSTALLISIVNRFHSKVQEKLASGGGASHGGADGSEP